MTKQAESETFVFDPCLPPAYQQSPEARFSGTSVSCPQCGADLCEPGEGSGRTGSHTPMQWGQRGLCVLPWPLAPSSTVSDSTSPLPHCGLSRFHTCDHAIPATWWPLGPCPSCPPISTCLSMTPFPGSPAGMTFSFLLAPSCSAGTPSGWLPLNSDVLVMGIDFSFCELLVSCPGLIQQVPCP